MDIIEVLKSLNILSEAELNFVDGRLRSEPLPRTAKELASIIREAREYVKNQKKA